MSEYSAVVEVEAVVDAVEPVVEDVEVEPLDDEEKDATGGGPPRGGLPGDGSGGAAPADPSPPDVEGAAAPPVTSSVRKAASAGEIETPALSVDVDEEVVEAVFAEEDDVEVWPPDELLAFAERCWSN